MMWPFKKTRQPATRVMVPGETMSSWTPASHPVVQLLESAIAPDPNRPLPASCPDDNKEWVVVAEGANWVELKCPECQLEPWQFLAREEIAEAG